MAARAQKSDVKFPGLVRVFFDSLAPVHLLLRLIRSAESSRGDNVAARAAEFSAGQSYCLIDARIDDDKRCATIYQIFPKYRLLLGGVYLTRALHAGDGLAYLEFLRNPKLAIDCNATPSFPTGLTVETSPQTVDADLSVLLLADGAVLRSATMDDLTHLTAEQNYVRLHLANGECTPVRGPLQKYENVLPECFIRASRHIIMNVRNVQRLRRVSRDLSLVYFAGSDTTLVRGGKRVTIGSQEWIYPSEAQCMQCHTEAAGRSLGLETRQLASNIAYPQTGRDAHQPLTLNAINTLSPPTANPMAEIPYSNPTLAAGTLGDRARAYLHTTCSHCHRPDGPTTSTMDLRYSTALANTNACDVSPGLGGLGIGNARLIAPGTPDRSTIPARMNPRDNADVMPPTGLGTRVDANGVHLIRDWIASLAVCN